MELAAQLDAAGTRSADAVARLWRAGELSAKKDGIGVYKVPLCLAVSGQHGLANNALDEIVASLQRSPGVFAPPPLPDGVVSPDKVTNLLSEYRTYFDAVILAGACATQRWDIVSDAAIAELLSRQHGPTGGFMKKAGDANPLMALSVTCMTGMVLIARGRIAEARRAAAFVQRVIVTSQLWAPQRPTTELYLSVSPYASMPTRVPGIDRCLYVIGGQVKRAEWAGLDHFASVAMRVCDAEENFGAVKSQKRCGVNEAWGLISARWPIETKNASR